MKTIFYKLCKNKNNYREITRLEEYEKKYKKIIYDIDYAIKNNKELNFLHSGHCGDLIYSFAVIKKLSLTHKCNFYVGLNKVNESIYEKHPSGNIFINGNVYGDVDNENNYSIDIFDLLTLLDIIIYDYDNLCGYQIADITGDGQQNILDAISLIQIIMSE